MSDQPTCQTCPHFHETSTYYTQCRLNPPILGSDFNNWPIVTPNDWCGQHPQRQVVLSLKMQIFAQKLVQAQQSGLVTPR